MLRLDTSSTRQSIANLKAKAPFAIARALNRSIASAKTVMVRLVAQDMGIKQADLRDRIVIVSATPENHVAKITASAKRIPLIDFNARGPEPSRGRGRGVTARIGTGGRGRYPHAFIATMKSGHRGVFQRTDKRRLPIYELKRPSIAFVFQKHVATGLARAKEQLEKNLIHELRFAMRAAA